MRRLGLLLVVASLTACSALRDMFSAHAADAATAAGQSLTADRLAGLAVQVKGMPLQAPALSKLASVWVDYTLFATAVAEDRHLEDSASVLESMWPLVSQMMWDHFRERLLAGRTTFTPAQVDSAFNTGQLRAFQHILLQVPPNAPPATDAQKKAQIQSILQQANAAHGATFGALAHRYSDDGSKESGGFLGVWPHGHFVPPFEDAAWKLAPGGISPVVRSPFGYHIIRRPPLAEVRDSFALGVQAGIEAIFDSVYVARLRQERHLTVVSGAGAKLREVLPDADAAERDHSTLVTYRGGAFRVSDLVRWLHALDPQLASQIPSANDAQITRVLETLSTRQVLLEQADSAGVKLTAEDWTVIKADHDTVIASIERALNLTPAVFRDSAPTAAARLPFAIAHVDAYLDAVVSRRRGFAAVPPFLASTLRAHADWRVNPAGVQRAAEQATVLRGPETGAPGGPGPAGQVPPMRPAPGPAPAPGDTTLHRELH